MQHTAPPLKTQHFPSPPHLHLGPWPKHVLITLMSQTRTSGHAFTTPYSLTTQPCSKKLPSHSSTTYPIWLGALPASWAGSTGPHTAQVSDRLPRTVQQNNQPPSYNTTPVKQPTASRCLACSSKQSLHPASHWGPTDICTQVFALWVTSSTSGGRSCTTTYSPSSSNLCTPSSYPICGT